MPLSLTEPVVGGDNGSWGSKLNAALDAIVSFVNALETTLAAKLGLAGGVLTGRADLATYTTARIDKGSISGAQSLDLAGALYFTATINGATTLSIANVPVGTFATGIILRFANAGSAAITWPASVKWPGGSAPAFTVAGIDLIVLVTDDNGTTWRASAVRDIR